MANYSVGAATRLGISLRGDPNQSHESIYLNEFDSFVNLKSSNSVERTDLLWNSKPLKNDLRHIDSMIAPKKKLPSVFKQTNTDAFKINTGHSSIMMKSRVDQSFNAPYAVHISTMNNTMHKSQSPHRDVNLSLDVPNQVS